MSWKGREIGVWGMSRVLNRYPLRRWNEKRIRKRAKSNIRCVMPKEKGTLSISYDPTSSPMYAILSKNSPFCVFMCHFKYISLIILYIFVLFLIFILFSDLAVGFKFHTHISVQITRTAQKLLFLNKVIYPLRL